MINIYYYAIKVIIGKYIFLNLSLKIKQNIYNMQ